jgi:hypothetical protein
MKYLKAFLCFLPILGVTVLYNFSFEMHITPAGQMGQIDSVDFLVSLVYMVLWITMSIFAGYKGLKSLYAGGIIYSCLPFIGLLGMPFIGNSPLAALVIIIFYLGAPLQGISIWLQFVQLPLIIGGYYTGIQIKNCFNPSSKAE